MTEHDNPRLRTALHDLADVARSWQDAGLPVTVERRGAVARVVFTLPAPVVERGAMPPPVRLGAPLRPVRCPGLLSRGAS